MSYQTFISFCSIIIEVHSSITSNHEKCIISNQGTCTMRGGKKHLVPPEIIGVRDFLTSLDSRASTRNLIQANEVTTSKRDISLSKCSNQYLSNTCKWATTWQPMPIQGSANEEHHVGQAHCNCQWPKSRPPSISHLHVHHCGEGHDCPNRHWKVEQVEESVKVVLVVFASLIELVCSKRRHTGPYPCNPKRGYVRVDILVC